VRADREEWEGMTKWRCQNCGCDWSGQWRRFKTPGGVNATRPDWAPRKVHPAARYLVSDQDGRKRRRSARRSRYGGRV